MKKLPYASNYVPLKFDADLLMVKCSIPCSACLIYTLENIDFTAFAWTGELCVKTGFSVCAILAMYVKRYTDVEWWNPELLEVANEEE